MQSQNPQFCEVPPTRHGNHFSNVYYPPPEGQNSTHVKNVFFVDSRDIQAKDKISDFEYSIVFDTTFKNVHSIELKGISFPKIANENYVILDIDECKDRLGSIGGSAADRTFSIVYFDNVSTGVIRPMRGADFDQKKYKFNPVASKLGKIQIKFKKQDGSVVTQNDVNNVTNHTLLFEIVTKQ